METLRDSIPTWVTIELVLLFIIVVLGWLLWRDAFNDEKEADNRDEAYAKLLKNQTFLKDKLDRVEAGIASLRVLLQIQSPETDDVMIVRKNGTKIVELDPDAELNKDRMNFVGDLEAHNAKMHPDVEGR